MGDEEFSEVFFDDVVVPTDFLVDASGTLINVPGTKRDFWIGSREGAGPLNRIGQVTLLGLHKGIFDLRYVLQTS